MPIGPNDQITTSNLDELFITDATSTLIGSTAPPTPQNKIWWSTLDAAVNFAKRYGGKVVKAPPYYPQVWHNTTFEPPTMNYLSVGNALVNAGELGQTFTRYPEDVSPGTADRENRLIIEAYQTSK